MRRELPQGWSEGVLADVISKVTGGTSVNCEDRPRRPSEKGMLRLGAVSSGILKVDDHKTAVASEAARLKTSLKVGTVLFVRKNTPDLVGRAAFVDKDYEDLFLPDLLWELRPKKGVSARWLHHWLESPSFQEIVHVIAAGSSQSMVGINRASLLTSWVRIPSPEGQAKIVEVLDAWDRAIEQAERLIAAKSLRLHGSLRRALFGGGLVPDGELSLIARRVAGLNGWPLRVIGDFAREVSRFNRDGRNLPVLSCTKHDGLVLSDEYFSGRRIYSEDTSTYKVVDRGEFAYATNHLEEGSIGIQAVVDRGLVSPMYTVFEIDESLADRRFVISLLKTETYRRVFEMSTSSSVDRRGGLRWADFAKLPFPIPAIEQQRRIATAVEALEQELNGEVARLDLLRTQKRALMQKLLTGEWQLSMPARETLA